ncbi:MAG TPA: hypothetical protein VGL93_10650 [Streptosporangiaceae bacterium]|jgi:hypothetical protein
MINADDLDEEIRNGTAEEFGVFPKGPDGEQVEVTATRWDGDDPTYDVYVDDPAADVAEHRGTVYLSPGGLAHGETLATPPITFTADDLADAAMRLYRITTRCDHGRNLDETCADCGRNLDETAAHETIAAAVAELRQLAASGPIADPTRLGEIADQLATLTTN